jgi:hypothetical protein
MGITRSKEKHINSVHILEQAWEYCYPLGIDDAVVAAQYAHLLRSLWTAELWGFRTRSPHYWVRSYAPESTQGWTKNAERFFVWDSLARGKLVLKDYSYIKKRKAQIEAQVV